MTREERKVIQARWEKAHDFIYDIQGEINSYDGYFYLEESSSDIPGLLDDNSKLETELDAARIRVNELKHKYGAILDTLRKRLHFLSYECTGCDARAVDLDEIDELFDEFDVDCNE